MPCPQTRSSRRAAWTRGCHHLFQPGDEVGVGAGRLLQVPPYFAPPHRQRRVLARAGVLVPAGPPRLVPGRPLLARVHAQGRALRGRPAHTQGGDCDAPAGEPRRGRRRAQHLWDLEEGRE